MNLNEFKAWFEGFTDGIDSNPSEKQWEKIKAKVAEITPEPTSPVVIREYWNTYRRYWNEPYWYGNLQPYAIAGMGAIAQNRAVTDYTNDARFTAAQVPDFSTHMTLEAGDGGAVFATLNEATFRAMGAADAAMLNGEAK